MGQWLFIIIGASVCAVLGIIAERSKRNSSIGRDSNKFDWRLQGKKLPYKLKSSLLTHRELRFYNCLKPIADKHGLIVVVKPRIADFIEVTLDQYKKGSGFWNYFGRIAQKHADFLLCNPVTFAPMAAVELDDSSHADPKRKERDAFVDSVYQAAGIPVIHIYEFNSTMLDEKLCELIGKEKALEDVQSFG